MRALPAHTWRRTAFHTGALLTLADTQPEPASEAARPELDTDNPRLLEAVRRYDEAYRGARPGTASAAALAQARLDLTLLLDAQTPDAELPDVVRAQLERDAQTLLATTPDLGS